MKRSSKILIIAILSTVCLLLIACGAKITSIYFETEPRKTFVQGQEFTLDDATLVAMAKDKNKPVDMAGVTVSGYNKDQIGQQTVTITYEGQTLEFKVTVIPRIALEGITKDYFVGDSFDKSKGRLRIADDNANIKSINMSEDAVTVEGFDSETPGKKTLTVKYGDYTGTFTVTVYNAETVELSKTPKRNTYYSHNTKADFVTSGAYFTVTANNGSLTRMVEATPDMVEGFEPSAATVENMSKALDQTVKFKYLGKSFDFKIKIYFSAVSYALEISKALEDNNVTPENAQVKDKEQALDALLKYTTLTDIDKKLISSDVLQKLLEIGIPYGAELFAEEAAKFSDTITLRMTTETDEETQIKRIKGKINIIATSYDAVKEDLEALQEVNVPLLEMADSLYKLKEEFYAEEIGDETIDEILGTVFETGAIDEVTKAFKLMIELHDTLKDVEADWQTSENVEIAHLSKYETEVRAAVAIINASDYKAFESSATVYQILSSWRPNDDFFDIIYAYYYYNDRENLVSALWEKVYMPGLMQDLFTMHNFACQEAFKMRVGEDTSAFIYYYSRANEIAEQIKASGNKLHINLYNAFNFDRLIADYLFFGTEKIQDMEINGIAYVYHASSLVGNATYEKLLADFFELFKLSMQEGFSFEDENVKELAKAMLDTYATFTPNERFAFLSSLHCDYRVTTSHELVLSHTVGEDGVLTCFNYFTYLLYSSYKEILSEDAYSVFSRLMEASEMYALRYHNSELFNGFTDNNGVEHLGFVATMAKIIEDASTLSDSDKELFASLLADMTKVYGYETAETPYVPTLTDEQNALFAELKAAIETFYKCYNTAISEDTDAADKFKHYAIAFSAFERAKSLAAQIRAIDNADVLYTLLHVETAFNINVDVAVSVNATYDYMLDSIGSIFYLTTLRTETDDGSNVCTIYWNSNISAFLNDAYDVFLAVYNGTLDETYVDDVQALKNAYSALVSTRKDVLKELGVKYYYDEAIKLLTPKEAA